MIVCLCKNISESKILTLAKQGCQSVIDFASTCGAGSGCGSCISQLEKMIVESKIHLTSDSTHNCSER